MKRTRRILLGEIIAAVLVSITLVCLFETQILPEGLYASLKTKEFIFATGMELLTLAAIPLALYLFKLKNVSRKLKEKGFQALLKWGTIRIILLAVPLLLNVLSYYLFTNATFGYMAIIVSLTLFFIYPTQNRCITDIEN